MELNKPFNKEKAKAGDPVMTVRGGIIKETHFIDTSLGELVVAIHIDGLLSIHSAENGERVANNVITNTKLCMAPVTQERWINIKPESGNREKLLTYLYPSEEEAIQQAAPENKTVRIEWKE